MLDLSSDAMRKEIDSFSQRLQALKQEFRDRGKVTDANQVLLDRIQQHKDRLAATLSDAERTGNWASVRQQFDEDWNSLVVDLEMAEEQLYE